MKLTTMMKLFGSVSDRKENLNLCHQDLLEMKGALTRFEDLPMGTFTMFISHEWLSRSHPDPLGVQLDSLCSVLRRLRSGEFENVSMSVVHRLTYKHNFSTNTKEWNELLTNAYVWFDWWSQPQPSVETIGTPKRTQCEFDLAKALRSTAAYVERCDCMVILAPGAKHCERISSTSGRKAFVCYRTWRRRAFCVLEFFASYLSRRQSFPVLLMQSTHEKPKWISAVEAQKLAVGTSTFSCCEMNHPNGMECDKIASWEVLDKLIQGRVKYDREVVGSVVDARFTFVLRSWWQRGLLEDDPLQVTSLDDFKFHLRWKENEGDGKWLGRGKMSLLIYACANANMSVVADVLHLLPTNNMKQRTEWLEHRVCREGFVNFGIPGGTNALFASMAWGTPNIVELLLENGASPDVVDRNGVDPFMYASYYGRESNINFWLERFKDWDVHRGNRVTGANALTLALSQGPLKFETAQILLKAGINISQSASSGVTNLMVACSNEDSYPDVVRFLLSSVSCDPNARARPRGIRWTAIRHAAKTITKLRLVKHDGLAAHIANGLGTTALHYASRRGDVEIVELLLSHGADPNLKNSLGVDAASMATAFPELKGMLEKRERMMKLRGTGKKTGAVEVLGKRISTATPIQHEMWLISLETLLMLYGEGSHGHVMEVHQKLRDKFLTPWHSVPADAEIIFVSI